MKNPSVPIGNWTHNLWLVAQCLDQLHHRVPPYNSSGGCWYLSTDAVTEGWQWCSGWVYSRLNSCLSAWSLNRLDRLLFLNRAIKEKWTLSDFEESLPGYDVLLICSFFLPMFWKSLLPQSSIVKHVFDHPENTDSKLLLVINKLPVNMAPRDKKSLNQQYCENLKLHIHMLMELQRFLWQ